MTLRVSDGPAPGASPAPEALPRWWIPAVFVGFALSFATWSLSSPLMSSPDEPAHMIRAAAVWHGQMGGERVRLPPDPAAPNLEVYSTEVEVPAYYAHAGEIPVCFAGRPQVPASCSPEVPADDTTVTAATTAGVYTPVYYLLVGWPSALTASGTGAYLMRLTAAVWSALFATLAVVVLARLLDRRLALLAVWVAATPMVHFLAGTVNPNGLEISAALAAWCSALVLCAAAARGRLDRVALWAFAVSAVVMVPLRTLSPAYLAVVVVAAVAFHGGSSVRVLARERQVWLAAVPVVAATAASVVWARSADQLGSVSGTYAPEGENIVVWLSGSIDDWVRQMIGVFGWLDTGPVVVSLALWLGVVAVVVAFALMWARPWRAVGVLCVVAGALVLPVIIQAPVAGEHGIAWQGRYLLPVAVGVPLMALLGADDDPGLSRRVPLHRLAALVLAACGAALVVAHVVTMQRYVTGTTSLDGTTAGLVQDYLAAEGWAPPVPKALLLAVAVVAAAWPAVVVRVDRGPGPPPAQDGVPEVPAVAGAAGA